MFVRSITRSSQDSIMGFSGAFFLNRLADDLSGPDSAFKKAIEEGLASHAQAVRESLKNDPQWANIADKISVSVDAYGGLTYSFTGTGKELNQFNEAEYGGLGTPPSPKLRVLKNRYGQKTMDKIIAKAIKKAVK